MPMIRYKISNEFNLGHHRPAGLCKSAATNNDPSLVLDGVAVAGLIGLLRQLGDLAQFAAEIFHDLHEEVMATGARSHGLVDRMHRLEAHVSSTEKNLLSRTDHTQFYYNTGIDWHPQMFMKENIITQGGMPRFVGNFYEASRDPPQLFLLDKFDINGAGACLKRFSDPSFFNAQQTVTEAATPEAKKEWKTRKIKKKGCCWRNGDSPEVLPSSRSKLHQLLHEESTGVDRKLHYSVKKKCLNSSRSSKSYMQKFLQTMSAEHSATPEIEDGQGLGSVAEESFYFPSIDLETKPVRAFKYSYDFNSQDFTPRLYGGCKEKEQFVTGENRHANDDVASATEYNTDAFAGLETEIEAYNGYRPTTDNEYRRKKQYRMSKQERDQSLDFLSVDKSNTSDDGSVSYLQETSSSLLHGMSPYDNSWTSMEHGDRDADPFPSTETFEDSVTHSNQILPAVDHTSNIYTTESSDVNSRSTSREVSDCFNNVMGTAQKTYGNYWADAAASALLGLNVDYGGLLSARNRDHAGTDSLSGYQETEGHRGSNNLSQERNPAVTVALKGSSDNMYDYAPSRNKDSGQLSISISDHQEVESQCSSSISPRYLADPDSCWNEMEEFRRPQEVSFKQYDQDMKPLHDNHDQISKRPHLDTLIDSTSSRILKSPPSTVASIRPHSSQQWLLHPEEAVLNQSDSHPGQISMPKEASGDDFPSPDKSLKQERQEMMFQSDSMTHTFGSLPREIEANFAGAPSLPPPAHVQRTVGKPHYSSHDSTRESGEFIMGSNRTSPNITSGVKGSFHNTALGEEVKKPHEAQTDDSSSHASTHNPGRFPFLADSMPLEKGTIDMLGELSHLTSEEGKSDSSIIHPSAYLEDAQTDTVAFARDIQQPGSSSPDSVTDKDDIKVDSICSTQFPVPLLAETTACNKETIQQKPEPDVDTVFPMSETTQPSVASQSTKPPLEDSVSELNASEVSMHSIDQSPVYSKSRNKSEHADPEEKIIKCIEMPGPQIMNEAHSIQEITSSNQEKSCLLGLPNHEDENLVENPPAKPLRPRKTLIKSVSALDRSKFKKVTPRNWLETPNVESIDDLDKSKSNKEEPKSRPETPNVKARDSVLEVIRTKSFNLKPTPAPVAKPVVLRAPTMNLKVSAILEKANRIRQATAGSDEDDDWSDE